jgi:2,3-bisphosphoglycerate-independent phosphoglycerate mutase
MDLEVIQQLSKPTNSKILLMVADGLGGLPMKEGGFTELETAHTPNMDKLAKESICGLHEPVGSGITPGSGPGHLGLFGYDPLRYQVGRGVLSALGVGFDLKPGDVAARGNFCTVDEDGKVTDRRAGRIDSDTGTRLCEKLREVKLAGAQVFVEPVKEHRFLLVLRGKGLHHAISDTDPQQTGVLPLAPEARDPQAKDAVKLVAEFVKQAGECLEDEHPANMVLLRGFAQKPEWPRFNEVFSVKAGAVASYPMYRGVAKLVGMDAVDAGDTLDEEIKTLRREWENFSFMYLHIKATDKAGEDGDFDRKVKLLEEIDEHLPEILEMKPDVMILTGDHSTPARMKSHSWHPVPVLLRSALCRPDEVDSFGERACLHGALGPRFPAQNLMPLAIAHAGGLEKFGA